ncbi:MAG: hypothetical protein SFW07_03235 [Gammaproteobacteria bacterium]|nr:hypothetical protein [Gammaproteobacteria bacterium]
MSLEFLTSKIPPLPRERSAAPLSETKALVKHGFGIDEFLEEFESLSRLYSKHLKKAADCKNEKKRLSCLMKWAIEHSALLLRNRRTSRFDGRAFDSIQLILYKIEHAFDEEVKRVRAETKVPAPKVYDFGLKNFLSHYSAKTTEELKKQFEDIHLAYSTFSSEIAVLQDLIGWVRSAQKEFQFDLEALKILEAIKFRLRVGLAINRVLERTSQKTESLSKKKYELKEKLKDVTVKLNPLKETENANARVLEQLRSMGVDSKDFEEKPRDVVFPSPKEISAKVKVLEAEIAAINSALLKIAEKEKHQNISMSLITGLEKLSESDSTIEMPIVTCDTKAEKALVDKVQQYMERHNKRVDSFSSRKSPVFTSSTESETSDTPVEPEEIFEEESPEEKQEHKEELRLFRFQNERRERAKFGLSSSSPIEKFKPEPVKVATPEPEIKVNDMERRYEEMQSQIANKQSEINKLLAGNQAEQESRERYKKQISAALNLRCDQDAYGAIPAQLRYPKHSAIMKGAYDGYFAAMERGDEKQKLIHLRNAAGMSVFNRIRVALGFNPSEKYRQRESAVKKYFDRAFVKKNIVDGLENNDEAKVTLFINYSDFDKNLDKFPELKNSFFSSRREIEKNNNNLQRLRDELTQLHQSLAVLEQQVPDEMGATFEEYQEASVGGFSFDEDGDDQSSASVSPVNSLSQ